MMILKLLKIGVNNMGAYIQLPEVEIAALYQDGISLRDLSRIYKVDKSVIKRRLIKHGFTLRTLSEANRIYSFDENIFANIDSHEKAYWLGFLAADGSICNNTIKIGLSAKDKDHLEKFRSFLTSNHPISNYTATVLGKQYETISFSVHSDKMTADLAKWNIVPRKSKTLEPANIDDKYISSYLLGLVDGDGGFGWHKKPGLLPQLRMFFISSLPICRFMMTTLVNECNISETKIIQDKRSPDMYYCYYLGNNKVQKIADYLYRDAVVWLDRKRNIVYQNKEVINENYF